MRHVTGTPMDGAEITEYLDSHWRGVLCFGTPDGGHGTAVSFAYDAKTRKLYFRLAGGPDDRKPSFVDDGERVTLVSYDRTDGDHETVVAEGRLEAVAESALGSTVRQSVEDLKLPTVGVFGQSSDHEAFRLVSLDIDSVSGRREAAAYT